MARSVWYVPDRVFTAVDDRILEGHAVEVADGRVGAVAPVGGLPADAAVERLPGLTLMPGMIDAHVHLDLLAEGGRFEALDEEDGVLAVAVAAHARCALLAGVTTVRDCGSRGRTALDARRAIELGWTEAATIKASGPSLTVPKGHCWPFGGEVSGPEGCRRSVREHKAAGADFIKVVGSGGGTDNTYSWQPSFSQEELDAIVDEAHTLGMRVTVHCLCGEAMRRAARAGADQIEHGQFIVEGDGTGPVEPDVIDAVAAAGVAVTPTLTVALVQLERLDRAGDPVRLDRWKEMRDGWFDSARAMHRAGVTLVTGTDAGWLYVDFAALPREVAALREVGLGAGESLRAATSTASRVMGLDGVGSIAHGQRADLIGVEGNPLADVAALSRVRWVMAGGRLAGPSTM